jgi:hypothetical protein
VMSFKRHFDELVDANVRFKATLVFISTIWYFALFPGRLGFDYSESIRIMQSGESTDWWTASFWWFLRITSFNGNTIMVSSAISLLVLGYALFYLSESLVSSRRSNRKALVIFFCSPLYGGFGLNVSHDVFIASGIILFTGFHLRILVNRNPTAISDLFAIVLAGLLLITTHYGPFIIATNVALLLLKRYFRFGIVLLGVSTVAFLVSHIGVTQVPKYGLILPVLADIKCVAQHPQAEITTEEWDELILLAPRSEWENPTNCSMVDDAFRIMPSLVLDDVSLTTGLIKNYIGIAGRNSAVVAMAHIQRASVALPPPFFAGPPNQVILDPSIPIGLGTNTALQSYAGVLHPSIDEPSVAKKISYLKILEVPAQGLIFIINQASWFWGWGGLWLWPIGIYTLLYLKRRYEGSLLPLLSSTLVLHGLLLVLSAPLPRYVMSTIVMGNLLLLTMIFDAYGKYIQKDGKPL